MPALPEQFKDARSNVEPKEPDVANAIKAHKSVREVLERCDALGDMGIDTVLIGSYDRHVSIHRMKDVDVLSKVPEAGAVAPKDLLDIVEDALTVEYGSDRVERQARSIKVDFPDYDLSVDAVPARPCGDHWEIPDAGSGWEETDPPKLAELSTAMNASYDEHYVPTVKLIRQTRRTHLKDDPPGGLYLEIATYHAFKAGLEGDSAAAYFVAALDGVAKQLAAAAVNGLPDPTLEGKTITTRAKAEEIAAAAELFRELAADAHTALNSDEACAAAKTFRDVLGRDSDDAWVFPMPSYCNDDGTRRSKAAATVAGSPTVTEDSRFA